MDPNALYSALNTIAQCSAALAALIGFLGLWRLDRLRAEREQALQLIYRRPYNSLGADQEIARLGEEFFVQNAEAYVRQPEQARSADGPAGLKLKQATARWRAIPGEQRQLMDVLQHFLRRTLVILALMLLASPALAGPMRCQIHYEPTLNRLMTLCSDDTKATSRYNTALDRWETTVMPPPGQTCTRQVNPRTRQWEGWCR